MAATDIGQKINESYDQALAAQKAQLKAAYDEAISAYNAQLSDAPAAYQTLKNEAYVNNALLEKSRKESVANMGLSGAGGTSQTFQQRNTNTLLNTLGDASRQQQDYTDEINRALANLDTQYGADASSLLAQIESERNAALVSQNQWQASYDMSQQSSIFEQAYTLLASKKITNAQFEAMTGIDLK
ncbi:MAG: hypothetical protein PHO15_00710 [Eubacteriales bacterium]|nr:hypothetical protein [Eubacteriales bacterium]